MVEDEAELDVLVDVIRQVNGDVGPARGVLGCGGGTRKAPLPLASVLQATAVAGDLAVPVASKAATLSVVGTVHQTGAGLLVDGDVLEAGVVGWETGVGRGADFKVGAVRKALGVLLGTERRLEVVPGVEVRRLALEKRVNKQLGARHGDGERKVRRRRVAVVVVVGVVGVGEVGAPALLAGGAATRNVGCGERTVLPADAAGRHEGGVG